MPEKHVDATASEPNSPRRNSTKLVLGLLLLVFGIFAFFNGLQSVTDDKMRLISPNSSVISVEVAKTPEQRSKGLMYRESLDKNAGMLFVFEQGEASCFWMKNTPLPLDMIWLDDNKQVVHIHKNAEPYSEKSICPSSTATYVLEVGAGRADELGFAVGEKVAF